MKNVLHYIRKSEYTRILYPAVLILAGILVLCQLPITEYFRVSHINDTDSLSVLINRGETYIESEARDLYYTGEDYYVDGVLTGHYYYELNGNYCRFYILKPETGKPATAYIAERIVTGKILKANVQENSVLADFAATLNWSAEGLAAVSDPYLINEIVYFPLSEKILFGIVLVVLLFGIIGFVYTLMLLLFPKLSPAYTRLRKYGNPDRILKEAETELQNEAVFKRTNVVLTPKYLISYSQELTAVIPLESVLWIFTLQNLTHSIRENRDIMHYSLRIVTITGDRFMVKDLSKNEIDQIMDLLSERYPNFFYGYSDEHDRMVRYILRENKKELQNRKKAK